MVISTTKIFLGISNSYMPFMNYEILEGKIYTLPRAIVLCVRPPFQRKIKLRISYSNPLTMVKVSIPTSKT